MRGRVEVLVTGLLVALAASLSGCVAQTADDGDEAVAEASLIGTAPVVDTGDQGTSEVATRASSAAATAAGGRSDGHDVMGEPEPVPWKPPTPPPCSGDPSRKH